MSDDQQENQVAVFTAPAGEVQFILNGDRDTLWGTRQQIADAFGCTEKNVLMHIRNIYEQGELDKVATCKEILLVQTEGGRQVKRTVEQFNLDVMLSVGYRVNSQAATVFRKWATATLKQFLTAGYILDDERLAKDPAAQRDLFNKLRAIRHVPEGTRGFQGECLRL